jgi:protein deglycase
MKKVFIHFAEGFEEIEAITPVDVLRRAGHDVVMVSVSGNYTVSGAHDVTVTCDALFEEINYNEGDIVILPGGMPGSKNLDEHSELKKVIAQYNENGKPIAAICAAPMVFGHMGLLEGKTATCYPGVEPELKGANASGKPTEVDGNIITGKGPGAAIAFSLAIVEYLNNKEQAKELGEKMVV